MSSRDLPIDPFTSLGYFCQWHSQQGEGGVCGPPFKACAPSQKILGGKRIQNQRCGVAQKADKIIMIIIII